MKVHYFQHVPFEGLGCIETWLAAHGIDADSTRFDKAARLPAVRDIDLLIVLGGPMSANDARAIPLARRREVASFARLSVRASGSWAFALAHS